MSEFILTSEYYNYHVQERIKKLEWLKDEKGIAEQVRGGFKFYDQCIAIHHLANQNEEINYRKLFFTSGLMWHYINEKYQNPEKGYWFPPMQVCYTMYSDNIQLINLVNKSDSFPFNGEYIGNYFSQMLLAIATNNWDKLSDVYSLYMATFENSGTWYDEKDIYTCIFGAFIDRDVDKLSSQINLLESPKIKKVRIKEDQKEQYFSNYSTTFIKLAKMYGMELDVDSETVPSHLLSYSPLEEYTIPYKFLRDFYREQSVDWRYDPVYPELQDWANDPENPDKDAEGFYKKLFS